MGFSGISSGVTAVNTILETTESLLVGTFASNGTVNAIPYTWERGTKVGRGR